MKITQQYIGNITIYTAIHKNKYVGQGQTMQGAIKECYKDMARGGK